MSTVSTSIFIITMLSASVRAAGNDSFRTTIDNDEGEIQSPNLGNEYGKKSDYIWRFNIREGEVLKLKLTYLMISYYDEFDTKQCGDAYRVLINRGVVDCKKRIRGGGGGGEDRPIYYSFYSAPSCSRMDCNYDCSRHQIYKGFVEVWYLGSDGQPYGAMPSNTIGGFKMKYEHLDCPPDETNSIPTTTTTTTMTTLTRAITTKTPKTISRTTTALSTSTTTTNRAIDSNSDTNVASYPIAVGFPPLFETTRQTQSSANVTSVNDVKSEEGSSDALIYGSIGGGIVFVILLLIAVFSIVRQTQQKKKTKETTAENGNAAMTDNVLYGTSGDFDGDRGDPSVSPAVVYATVDKSAKSRKNDVGLHGKETMYEEVGDFNNTKQSNQSDEIVDATPPTNQKLMYSSVAIDASGEKSTLRYEKGG